MWTCFVAALINGPSLCVHGRPVLRLTSEWCCCWQVDSTQAATDDVWKLEAQVKNIRRTDMERLKTKYCTGSPATEKKLPEKDGQLVCPTQPSHKLLTRQTYFCNVSTDKALFRSIGKTCFCTYLKMLKRKRKSSYLFCVTRSGLCEFRISCPISV
jgi:hypothetical protein